MNRLEFIALVSNAPGYPGIETLSALTFGLRLEVVGAAVSAASRTHTYPCSYVCTVSVIYVNYDMVILTVSVESLQLDIYDTHIYTHTHLCKYVGRGCNTANCR